ncbi:hypothetical protein GF406_09185 [candidate division KSB1 bacterium]|nr:hypothetical protein [candidate division KSB1 bacterium]
MIPLFTTPLFAMIAGFLSSLYTLYLLRWTLQMVQRRQKTMLCWMISSLRWLPMFILLIFWAVRGEIMLLVLWLVIFMTSKWFLLFLVWKLEYPIINPE